MAGKLDGGKAIQSNTVTSNEISTIVTAAITNAYNQANSAYTKANTASTTANNASGGFAKMFFSL